MKFHKGYAAYLLISALILLLPFAGMAFFPTHTAEKRELRQFPELRLEDGALNTNYLDGMGKYFQDHFALRDYMVTANAMIKSVTVGSESSDQVIIGQDGWLFFAATVNDYMGRSLMSERELYCAANNLLLAQQYAELNGSRFLFTIPPNKNSLYGQYMPFNYVRGTESNAHNIKPMLQKMGVSYVDLFERFENEPEELYFKRDSHWNNKGALIAYKELMEATGIPHNDYSNTEWTAVADHKGDIDELLYLSYHEDEVQYYSDRDYNYTYAEDAADHMGPWVETNNEGKDSSLLMYRDSFAESLIPFFANEFGDAYFTWYVPYDFTNIEYYQPDCVIVELVERNIINLIANATYLPGKEVEGIDAQVTETNSTIEIEREDGYLTISGEVDERYIKEYTDIYVSVSGKTYQPLYLTGEDRAGNRYSLYLNEEDLPKGGFRIQLIVSDEDNQYIVQEESYE